MKQQCYEFYGCREATCVRHKIPDEPCWELEGTPCKCHSTATKVIRDRCENKDETCSVCTYYEKYGKAYH